MQTLKDDIRDKILRAAKDKFLRKGYVKTSMREIADASGVGIGNIYNYFESKDDLFRNVVRPVIDQFQTMLDRHHGHYGTDALFMTSESYLHETIKEYLYLINNNRSLMKMLMFKAHGSSLENFRERFTDKATALVKEWLHDNKQRHPLMDIGVSDFFIHLHTVWMFSLFEEIIMHDIRMPEMEQIIKEYARFEIQGWRHMMNI